MFALEYVLIQSYPHAPNKASLDSACYEMVLWCHRRSLDRDRRLFGDLERLFHLLRDSEVSRLLCSSSFRFPTETEDGRLSWSPSAAARILSEALCREAFPEGVPAALDVPDRVAETKSITSLGALDLLCSLAFSICFCDALSSSAYAQSGNAVGIATFSESVEAYVSSPVMPAKSISFRR